MSFSLMMAMTAAIAATMGYMAARRRSDDEVDDDEGEGAPGSRPEPSPGGKGESLAVRDPKAIFAGMPLALGDVVSARQEERWLAGALVLREQGSVVAAVFLAPEGRGVAAVVAFAPPRREIFWMEPLEITSPDEPPATIEVRGVSMRRGSRLPVAVERLGQGAEALGPEALFATYAGRGREVAVLLASQGRVHAFAGQRLEDGEYDRLGEG